MKLKPTRLFDQQQLVRVGKRLCLSTIVFLTLPIALVEAQISPDESLSTQTEQQGENRLNIEGGEREGNNLFHSFREFSVPEGIEAVFENAPDIENIFTRITGESASAINGILRTQEGANFFLVNPNGIVFGENAQLDIGGSFIATTANSIQFEDGIEFIASQGQEKPILTVSVPIGLQFEGNNGAITVNGQGNQITPDYTSTPTTVEDSANSLAVKPGNTLGLIGGDINTSGATINANDGKIKIASVNSGFVDFQLSENDFALNFDDVASYQNIDLDNLSVLNASGSNKGDVFINAANVTLSNGSLILIQNQGKISSGTIDINATESITLSGVSPDGNVSSVIRSEATDSGKSADINISTTRLVLQNGGRIGAVTYSDAVAGSVTVNSSESVKLLENTLVNQNRQAYIVSGISSISSGSGNAGDLQLTTSNLDITSGASVQSSANKTGNGGDVNINAKLINISGINSNPQRTIPSAIAASTNSGNAGNLTINTSQLQIQNGGSIAASNFGTGNAGQININATESINVNGQNNELFSSIRSNVTPVRSEATQERLGLPLIPSGQGGDLTINTPSLNVNSGGQVSVANEGSGNAGTLFINADNLNLDNAGSITAASASGNGGNINIDTNNLQIDSGSQITATADNNGNGGNITINTTSLIAKKNSQVTANAFNGRGGNLDINAEGLFLFDSPSNIFSASSELGIDGTIQINTPDIDLQRELEQSELELPTTEEAIAGSCLARSNQQGSFTVNNGTGLPKSPNSNYSDLDSTLTGISSLPQTAKQPEVIEKSNRQLNTLMLPAERMVKTENGRVFLVAAPALPESLFCPKN
jgi:filamentous hemagglutinin family protein